MAAKHIRVRVAAVILNKKNEMLLVNHVKNGRSYWLFPGGGVEYGESLSEAIRRELSEELSIKKATVGKLIFVNDTVYPGKKRHILNLYFRVFVRDKNGLTVNPEGPLKSAAYVNMKEFSKLLFYPSIKNDIIKWWKKGFLECWGYLNVKWKK